MKDVFIEMVLTLCIFTCCIQRYFHSCQYNLVHILYVFQKSFSHFFQQELFVTSQLICAVRPTCIRLLLFEFFYIIQSKSLFIAASIIWNESLVLLFLYDLLSVIVFLSHTIFCFPLQCLQCSIFLCLVVVTS